MMDRTSDQVPDMTEHLEEIYTRKMGLAVSAFGSIIMGWGSYLRWWSFSYLVIWAAIAALDAWLDFVRLRDDSTGGPTAAPTTTAKRP